MYGDHVRPSSLSPTPQPPGAYPIQRSSPSYSTRTPTVYTINTMSSSEPSLTNGSQRHSRNIELSVWVEPAVSPEAAETARAQSAPRQIPEMSSTECDSKATVTRPTDALVPYRRAWTSLHRYPASGPPSPSQQPWRSPSPKPDDGTHVEAAISEWHQDTGTEGNVGCSARLSFGAEVEAGSQTSLKSTSGTKSTSKPKDTERQSGKRKSKSKRKGKGKNKKIALDDIAFVQQPSADAKTFVDAEPHNSAAPEGDIELAEDAETANHAESDDTTTPEDKTGMSDNVQRGGDSGWVDDAEPYFDTNAAWDAGAGAEVKSEREGETETYAESSDNIGDDGTGTGVGTDVDAGPVSTDNAKGEDIETSELSGPLRIEAGPTDPLGSNGSREAVLVSDPEVELEHGPNSESLLEVEPNSHQPSKEKSKGKSRQSPKSVSKDKKKSKSRSSAPATPTRSKSKTKARLSPIEVQMARPSRRKSSTASIAPNTSTPKAKPKAPKSLSNPTSRSRSTTKTPSKSQLKRQSTSHSAKTGGTSSRQQSLIPSNVEKYSAKKEPGCCGCCMM